MTLITSPSNPRISKLRDLHTARGRKKSGLFLMEGIHLLEALLGAGIVPQEVYYQAEVLQHSAKGRALFARLIDSGISQERLVEVNERVMQALGDVQTTSGVVSVLPLELFKADRLRARRPAVNRPFLLILDDIADPGNMGTLLRTALAADVESVLLTSNCVDCYSPKVVRAAAGAHVVLPIEADLSWQAIAEKVARHIQAKYVVASWRMSYQRLRISRWWSACCTRAVVLPQLSHARIAEPVCTIPQDSHTQRRTDVLIKRFW